jgi:hypothetical protein
VSPYAVELHWDNDGFGQGYTVICSDHPEANGGSPAPSDEEEIQGLEPGTTYRFAVYHLLGHGGVRSTATSVFTVTTPPSSSPTEETPPSAPTNLIASAVSGSDVRLVWDNSPDDEAGYTVERSSTGATGPWTEIGETGADVATFLDAGVEPGVNYFYRVGAFAGAGGVVAFSNVANAATPLAKVSVEARLPQTAEGGSEPGRFTILREGGDLSRSLTVEYDILSGAGKADPVDDFAAPSGLNAQTRHGTVTIAADAKFATIDVEAPDDSTVGEGNEWVTLVLTNPSAGNNDKYSIASETDSVQILDRNKLLVATYGHGPTGFVLGHPSVNVLFRDLVDEIASTSHYALIIAPESHGASQLKLLLSQLDANNDKIISTPESEANTIGMIGYSLGVVNVHNFAIKLNRAETDVAGYRLSEAVPIETLVEIDPVAVLQSAARSGVGECAKRIQLLGKYSQRLVC